VSSGPRPERAGGGTRAVHRFRAASPADRALQAGIVGIGVVLFVVFALISSSFSSGANLRNILMQVSVVGVVSIGETIVMLTGGIDLSVGSSVLFSSVVMSTLSVNHGWSPVLAIAVGLAAGLGIGLINGLVVVGFGIEPIIVTLGTLLIASGLGQILLQSQYITVNSHAFTNVAVVKLVGIPLMVWVMLALYAVAAFVMYRTGFGRSVYAIGDNRAAARLVGLPVGRRLVAVYALSGLLAGVAGYLEVGQLGIISQNDGSGMQFTAILGVLVGGLSVQSGGVGRVERTLVGTVIAGMIVNFLVLQGVPGAFEQAAVGGLILVAVLSDHVLRRGRA
jgi:ribose/xylose/arabinose/galactoside ABC-type transport system permease subunit